MRWPQVDVEGPYREAGRELLEQQWQREEASALLDISQADSVVLQRPRRAINEKYHFHMTFRGCLPHSDLADRRSRCRRLG
jgi:hypothetical protein